MEMKAKLSSTSDDVTLSYIKCQRKCKIYKLSIHLLKKDQYLKTVRKTYIPETTNREVK